jgi:hypothetical protein
MKFRHHLRVLPFILLAAPFPALAAPPTQISTCPYTIAAPGNYVVAKDLSSAGTCINFVPPISGVSLDLQRHSITGNGTGIGIACLTTGDPTLINCANVIIVNGTVSKFANGINFIGVSVIIADMVVQQSTGDGIALNGAAARQDTRGNIIANVVSSDNLGNGIFESNGGTSTIINSRADNNGGFGGGGFGMAGFVVVDSEADNNGGSGVAGNVVINSKAKNNARDGLGADVGGVINGEASGNGSFGITSAGGVVDSVAKNNGTGIGLQCPVSAFGNTAKNNDGGDIVPLFVPSLSTCELWGNKPAP